MSDEALAVALASDKLNIDEVEIIKAVREWATVNSVSENSIISFAARYVSNNAAKVVLIYKYNTRMIYTIKGI